MTNIVNLLKTLFVTDGSANKDFKRYTLEKTAKRGIVFAISILLVEVLMITLTFMVPGYFTEDLVHIYRMHYYILSGLSLLVIIFSALFKSGKIQSLGILEYFLMAIVILCLSWGASVSLLDQINSSQIAVYLTFMNLLAVGVLLPPSKMFTILVTLEIVFISLLPHFQQNHDLVFGLGLNSSFFLLFAFIISRQFYAEEYSNFMKDLLIQDQNESLTKQNSKLMYLNSIDPLTSLYNRQSLDNILESLWERSEYQNKTLNVFMMDVDKFKPFNDQHGHIAGDHCLIMISQILQEFAKSENGYAFRYGGDEFLFLLVSDDQKTVKGLIQRICAQVEEKPIPIGSTNLHAKLSLGHGQGIIDSTTNPWDIIHQADQKLYIYKTQK